MSPQEVALERTPYFFQHFVWFLKASFTRLKNKLASFSPGGATWRPFTAVTMVQWCCLELRINEVQPKKPASHVNCSGPRRVPVPGGGKNLKLKRAAVMFSEYWMIHENTIRVPVRLQYCWNVMNHAKFTEACTFWGLTPSQLPIELIRFPLLLMVGKDWYGAAATSWLQIKNHSPALLWVCNHAVFAHFGVLELCKGLFEPKLCLSLWELKGAWTFNLSH